MQVVKRKSETPSWTFAYASDMHVGSPRSYRFQPAWNENWNTARDQIIAMSPDFLIVGGDMTRDGSTHREELTSFRRELEGLPFPAHVIPGNHEVGNKPLASDTGSVSTRFIDQYESVFGPSNWSFVYKNVRFTGINAFLLGSGLAEERVLRTWIEDLDADADTDHHVWLLHPAPFADAWTDSAFDPESDRTAWYFTLDPEDRDFLMQHFQRTGTTHVVSGHIHCHRQVHYDGIQFIFAPSTAFAQWADRWKDGDPTLGFLRADVFPDRINFDVVPLTRTSDLAGYGPGGNPRIEGRDYSAAQEEPPFAPSFREDE